MEPSYVEHYLSGRLQLELGLHYCGKERCGPSHTYGPAMRDHYLLHYIVGGKGTFSANGCVYELKAGDSFCMLPNRPASYRADPADPWTYFWIGFGGAKAAEWVAQAQLSADSPTCEHPDPAQAEALLGELLHRSAFDDAASEAYCTGLLLQLLSTYWRSGRTASSVPPPSGRGTGGRKELYTQQAIRFIEDHYQKRIDVPLIARQIGLERAYFTKLFREHVGVPPHEFLLRYRMEKAVQLLSRTHLPVQVVAGSVGFDNPAYFGKLFASRLGHSPTSFRKYNHTLSGAAPNES